jgi:hypothetical protein
MTLSTSRAIGKSPYFGEFHDDAGGLDTLRLIHRDDLVDACQRPALADRRLRLRWLVHVTTTADAGQAREGVTVPARCLAHLGQPRIARAITIARVFSPIPSE